MSTSRSREYSRCSSEHLVLRVFRTVDDPDRCRQYLDGHRRRLSTHAIGNLHSAHDKWPTNPYVWVVVIEDVHMSDLIAGCRLHLAERQHPLPIVEALRDYDPRVYERIHVHYPCAASTGGNVPKYRR